MICCIQWPSAQFIVRKYYLPAVSVSQCAFSLYMITVPYIPALNSEKNNAVNVDVYEKKLYKSHVPDTTTGAEQNRAL